MENVELIQESVENVSVLPVESNAEGCKKFVKGALIVGVVVGTVLLVKKVIVPKFKEFQAKKLAAANDTQNTQSPIE